jgi:hypothetical protein
MVTQYFTAISFEKIPRPSYGLLLEMITIEQIVLH